jgi:predicted TIM-barrel fold metal-dependent hydrolase
MPGAAQAAGLIDRMRTSARQITGPDARRQALDACAAADQVLAAIIDHPDELPLARDFVNRFLEPATQVVTEYARLSSRNIPSARETLEQVEQHDLPLITHKANQLYDRLHRGTLIDLEVAREMLTLDMADTSVPGRPSEKEVRTP